MSQLSVSPTSAVTIPMGSVNRRGMGVEVVAGVVVVVVVMASVIAVQVFVLLLWRRKGMQKKMMSNIAGNGSNLICKLFVVLSKACIDTK